MNQVYLYLASWLKCARISFLCVVALKLVSFSKFQNSPRLLFSLEMAFECALSLFISRQMGTRWVLRLSLCLWHLSGCPYHKAGAVWLYQRGWRIMASFMISLMTEHNRKWKNGNVYDWFLFINTLWRSCFRVSRLSLSVSICFYQLCKEPSLELPWEAPCLCVRKVMHPLRKS